MPTTPHIEKHFTATETVRDVVIGMSDGLTVPFALAAGLSGAVASANTKLVIIAGLAEIAAGSIAMGLGGYLAARTDSEHYHSEEKREYREIVELPRDEEREVADIFEGYGLTPAQAAPVVAAICSEPKRWVDFMMRYELGLEAPDPRRAVRSAATIAVSYIIGGMIPLSPYFAAHTVLQGLWISVLLTLLALFVFGYIKGRLTGVHPLRGGIRTVVIGGLAAGAAFALARAIQ
jgi:VIT1/CCC1 family predicted Fe2+/Mn2+ transporter